LAVSEREPRCLRFLSARSPVLATPPIRCDVDIQPLLLQNHFHPRLLTYCSAGHQPPGHEQWLAYTLVQSPQSEPPHVVQGSALVLQAVTSVLPPTAWRKVESSARRVSLFRTSLPVLLFFMAFSR